MIVALAIASIIFIVVAIAIVARWPSADAPVELGLAELPVESDPVWDVSACDQAKADYEERWLEAVESEQWEREMYPAALRVAEACRECWCACYDYNSGTPRRASYNDVLEACRFFQPQPVPWISRDWTGEGPSCIGGLGGAAR